MTSLHVTTHSPEETLALGRSIGDVVRRGDIVLLSGDLGAGKTVFARGLASSLGIEEPVVSPTFTIVREYEGRIPMVHVDVYRLETTRELHDLGFDDIVREDAVTVVEWGDILAPLFPEWLEVQLVSELDDVRVIELTTRGATWTERADALARAAAGFASSTAGS